MKLFGLPLKYYLAGIAVSLLFMIVFFMMMYRQLELVSPSSEEMNWTQARQYCEDLQSQWRLPHWYELLMLHHVDKSMIFIQETDYWSHDRLFGRAFGLNTGLGILSFDVIEDEDHVVCVRP